MLKFKAETFKGYNTPQGQHATELVLSVTGEKGACVWRMATGVSPMGHWPSRDQDANLLSGVNLSSPQGMGFAAHDELDLETAYEEDFNMKDSCAHLEGRPCVCTNYYSSDKNFMQAFACEGFAGVERLLTEHYIEHYKQEI